MNNTHKKQSKQQTEQSPVEETAEQKGATAGLQEDEWQIKAEEYLAGWQRCRADYENQRKETEKRIQDAVKYGTEQLLMELAPTIDHFKYAFAGIPDNEKESGWVKGIEYIQSNFTKILEAHGVEMIRTVGEQFNPELHEALEEVEAEGKESGTITEEIETGFLLHGKVVRVAKVKVVK